MAEIPYWETSPDAWNQLTLGPHIMPGVWRVRYDAKFIVDVAKAKNADGATIIDLGRDAIELTLTGMLTSRDDWERLTKIIPELNSKRPAKGATRGERVTYDVLHPAIQLIGIRKIYITLISAPEIQRGVMTINIRAVEVAPIIKKKGKGNAANKKTARTTSDIRADDEAFLAPNSLDKGPYSGSYLPLTPPGP